MTIAKLGDTVVTARIPNVFNGCRMVVSGGSDVADAAMSSKLRAVRICRLRYDHNLHSPRGEACCDAALHILLPRHCGR